MTNTYLHIAGDANGAAFGSATDVFLPVSGEPIPDITARTTVEVRDRTGFTVNNGFFNAVANEITATSTLRFHDDGTDVGPNVSITASTTGIFIDATSVTITSGSLICSHLVVGTSSMAGHDLTAGAISFTLEHASSEKSLLMSYGAGWGTASNLTEFGVIASALGEGVATENDVEYTIRFGATASDLRTWVTLNENTANSAFLLRDDAASTSLSATLTASTTGEFEDTTNTPTVATGSTVNLALATGTSSMSNHDVDISVASLYLDGTGRITASGDSIPSVFSAGGTTYQALEGSTGAQADSNTEADAQVDQPFAFDVEDLYALVTVAPDTNSTVAFRDDGSSVLAVTLTASTTGIYENNGSVSVASGSSVNFVVTILGVVDTTIPYIGIELVQVAVDGDQTVLPGAAALVLEGFIPTVTTTDDKTVAPAQADLTLTGFLPTLVETDNKAVAPAQADLTLTGFAPTLVETDNKAVAPAQADLALTGFVPVLVQTFDHLAQPAAAALTLTGFIPTVDVAADRLAQPGAGALTLEAFAPTLVQTFDHLAQPAATALTLEGFIPVVSSGAGSIVTPAAAALTLEAFAPTLVQTFDHLVQPTAAVLTLAGFIPTMVLTEDQITQPAQAELTLEGFTPVLAQTFDHLVRPAAAALALQGFAPTAITTGDVAVAGTRRMRQMKSLIRRRSRRC